MPGWTTPTHVTAYDDASSVQFNDETVDNLQFLYDRIQAGNTTTNSGAGGGFAVAFPFAFPTALLAVLISSGAGDVDASLIWSTKDETVAGFNAVVRTNAGAIPAAAAYGMNWVAVGY